MSPSLSAHLALLLLPPTPQHHHSDRRPTNANTRGACGPLIYAVAIKSLSIPRGQLEVPTIPIVRHWSLSGLPSDLIRFAILTRPTNSQQPFADNLVKNPGFEEGSDCLINLTNGVLIPPRKRDHTSLLPGWMIESLKAMNSSTRCTLMCHPNRPRSNWLWEERDTIITQIIRTQASKCYNLSFAIGDARNAYIGNIMVEAFTAEDTLKVPFVSQGKGRVQDCQLQIQSTFCKNKDHILHLLLPYQKDRLRISLWSYT